MLKVSEPILEKPFHPHTNQFILRAHLQGKIACGTSTHMTLHLLLEEFSFQHQVKKAQNLLVWRNVAQEGWCQDRLFKPLPLVVNGGENKIMFRGEKMIKATFVHACRCT